MKGVLSCRLVQTPAFDFASTAVRYQPFTPVENSIHMSELVS